MLKKRTEKHETSVSPPEREQAEGMDSCRGRRIGAADLVECQTARGGHCKYALSFGYSFFCRHPRRMEFAARPAGGEKTE